ncbi:MAG TPA: alpha/beta fold hydrolase [Steroidobacteraceae bacterium]|jgi:2-hydroxy-6-oxonona-2,4-dienedioate hydrolase/4,5:9,10-diseco-3-hydroxy-5,9,17-trioxoandrosta-1(10),2-diene-4-oate hydrolase
MTPPSEGKTVEVDGRPVYYLDVGKGTPVVLLHGGGPGASGFSNYNRNIEALQTGYRLIIPDLPGYGSSGKAPISGPRYAAYAATVLGLLDQLKIPKAHFIGNSLGGGTAIKAALEAPQRVDRLVLMGPAGLHSAYTKVPTEGARMIFEYYAGEGPSKAKLKAFIQLMIYDSSALTDALLEQRYQASIDPEVIANPPLSRSHPPILEELWRDPRLSQLPHETLLLWGREDRVNPLFTAEILMNQLPNACMVSFTKCGHWVQWERAEAFNRFVSNFLGGGATA